MAAKAHSAPAESSKELTFEQALARLESIVADIEQGKIGLEESIGQYEAGMKLIGRCRAILADAEARIQQLQLAEDGSLSARPLGEGEE